MFLESQLLDAKKVKHHVITVVVSRLVPATPRFYLATVKKNSIWLLLDKIWELAWEQDQVLSLSRQKIVFPSPKCPPDVQTACIQILMCRRHNTRCSYMHKFLGNLILLCYTKITAYFSMYVLKEKNPHCNIMRLVMYIWKLEVQSLWWQPCPVFISRNHLHHSCAEEVGSQ